MDEPREYSKSALEDIGQKWLDRIQQSEEREDKWRKDAELAESTYLAEDVAALPFFNMLHSNVETIVPAIYNSTPQPDIRPRHSSQDPQSKAVADIIEQSIKAQIDDDTLDREIEGATQDGFMAGRGVVRVKYDATEEPAQTMDMGGQSIEVMPAQVTDERVIYEVVAWDDYRQGPAKRWREVPWVAYRHEVSPSNREELENPEYVALQKDDREHEDEDLSETIWEIWEKESRSVFFVVEASGKVLDIREDPLGLKHFFPQASPIQPITRTKDLTPVCPYSIYKNLADEVDTATRRINAIMGGLRVRGIIAAGAEDIEDLASLGDNELLPVADLEGLVAAGGLDKAVMWWPIETAAQVLNYLYQNREQSKQAIYEITGISDIVRGASKSSETATAQQIKTEWGSLRIKKMQRQVERMVRDLFKLTAEIVAGVFTPEGKVKASGMPEAAQVLQGPMDHYRIDVESDSTIRADLTKSRGEMSEFLQGTSQFFATMAPIVQMSPQSAGPLAAMYAAFAQQFNLGRGAETALDEFVQMAQQAQQQQGGEDPAQAEQAAKAQEFQMKAKADMARAQTQMQAIQAKSQADQAQAQADIQKIQMEMQLLREEHAFEREKMEFERQKMQFEASKMVMEGAIDGV